MSVEKDPLLESAKDFLVEALRNHASHKNAFAIVHAVTAAELVLKARLSRVHPALVWRDIDARHLGAGETVRLRDIPQRLANLGLPLHPTRVEMIGRFARWRNGIIHHFAPDEEEQAARARVPQLLDFIADYLAKELATPLRDFLPLELYKTADKELGKWKVIVAEAAKHAHEEGNVLDDACPVCGGRGVLVLRGEDRVFCHLCGSDDYRRLTCDGCGRLLPVAQYGIDAVCDECIEAAGDQYIQMEIDRRRGK